MKFATERLRVNLINHKNADIAQQIINSMNYRNNMHAALNKTVDAQSIENCV